MKGPPEQGAPRGNPFVSIRQGEPSGSGVTLCTSPALARRTADALGVGRAEVTEVWGGRGDGRGGEGRRERRTEVLSKEGRVGDIAKGRRRAEY